MPKPYDADTPDEEQLQLRVMDEHVTLTRFTHYTFDSDFLTPTDGFHFVMADEDLPPKELAALKIGAVVALTVNEVRVAEGYIDSIEIRADRGGGKVYTINGRDRLSPAVDAIADPTLEFNEGVTLDDFLVKLFAPFGWTNKDEHFVIDNSANRKVSTGGDRGIKMTKAVTPHVKKRGKGLTKGSPAKPLKSFVLHQTKPHNHEGVFDFAKRVAQRFGLWIWCWSDGDKLVVGKPDFDQEPLYWLGRKLDGTGNIISGTVKYDRTDQPSVVIADGFSGGGEFGKGHIKAFCVNPYFGVDEQGFVLDEVQAVIRKHPDAQQILMTTQPFRRSNVRIPVRPMFLHDDESKTPEQLEAFVRREMSLLIRKSLTAEYEVEGHGQVDPDGVFTAWAPDTVVEVDDEVAGIKERMYVLGVHYEKSRRGDGTTTRLHLIRLNSIQF